MNMFAEKMFKTCLCGASAETLKYWHQNSKSVAGLTLPLIGSFFMPFIAAVIYIHPQL